MMSQNPFGSPAPGAVPPPPLPPEPIEGSSRKGLLIGGLAGLVALVVAGGAFLVLSGDDEVEAALVVPPQVPSASETTEPPAPLPTLAEFNGRNPFVAKIVEASGSGDGGEAAPEGAAPAPVDADAPTGDSGSFTGSAPVIRSGSTTPVTFAPITSAPPSSTPVPGPAGPAGADGKDGSDGSDGTNGTNGTDGADGEDGADGVTTVYLVPGDITVTFLGYDLDEAAEEGEPDDPTLPDFQVNNVIITDVRDDPETPTDEAIFAYYFKLISIDANEDEDGPDTAVLQFGDVLYDVVEGTAVEF